jgi:TetR/AcrR family transcriptional regulator
MAAEDSTWDPDATKRSIVDAAEHLFIAGGFEGTSMAAIAREAGVTKSLIHHHFGCKAQLWAEVKKRRFAEYQVVQERVLRALSEEDDMEIAVSEAIDAYFEFARDNQEMMRLLAWMAIEGAPTVEHMSEQPDISLQAIEQAQKDGKLRSDVDAPFILMTMVGSIQHWFQMCPVWKAKGLLEDDREQFDAVFLKNLKRIVLEGVLPFDDD